MFSYREKEITDLLAIEKVLVSDIFKGIGAKTARAIVGEFGPMTFDIFKYDHALLEAIKGINSEKAKALHEAFVENEKLMDLFLLLKPFGVTDQKINLIYEKYKEEAINKLTLNPYRLCEDIYGFGFKVTDEIARAFGIAGDSTERIRAGLFYVLTDAGKLEGHCYLSKRQLTLRINKLIPKTESGMDPKKMKAILSEMSADGTVIVDEDKIFLTENYNKEVYIAKKLKRMAAMTYDINTMTSREIKKIEKNLGISYSGKQKQVLEDFLDSNVMIVTGGPGTGKTTVIKGLIEANKGREIVLAAPTGRAAKRMEEATGHTAATIHRLIGLSQYGQKCSKGEDNPIDADLIILDEGSMIDLFLFERFFRAVSEKRTRLIVVGDADQLSPVGSGSPFGDIIKSETIPTIKLDQIYRQDEASKIILNAHTINAGGKSLVYNNDEFVFIKEDNPENLPKRIREVVSKEIAKGAKLKDIKVISPFKTKTSSGSDSLNKVLQHQFNTLGKEVSVKGRIFKVGDEVICLKNDTKRNIFNGDIGIVKSIDPQGENFAVIDFYGREVVFTEGAFDELDLGYALNVYKCQGSEFEIVVMPLTTQHYIFLQRNVLYTAITRAKKKVILIGQWKALYTSIYNNKSKERNTMLTQRLIED